MSASVAKATLVRSAGSGARMSMNASCQMGGALTHVSTSLGATDAAADPDIDWKAEARIVQMKTSVPLVMAAVPISVLTR